MCSPDLQGERSGHPAGEGPPQDRHLLRLSGSSSHCVQSTLREVCHDE